MIRQSTDCHVWCFRDVKLIQPMRCAGLRLKWAGASTMRVCKAHASGTWDQSTVYIAWSTYAGSAQLSGFSAQGQSVGLIQIAPGSSVQDRSSAGTVCSMCPRPAPRAVCSLAPVPGVFCLWFTGACQRSIGSTVR